MYCKSDCSLTVKSDEQYNKLHVYYPVNYSFYMVFQEMQLQASFEYNSIALHAFH